LRQAFDAVRISALDERTLTPLVERISELLKASHAASPINERRPDVIATT